MSDTAPDVDAWDPEALADARSAGWRDGRDHERRNVLAEIRGDQPMSTDLRNAIGQPHAYAVETLWSRGGTNERWGMALEMADVRQPLDRGDAEELMALMIENGHTPDGVRLVSVTAVPRHPSR